MIAAGFPPKNSLELLEEDKRKILYDLIDTYIQDAYA